MHSDSLICPSCLSICTAVGVPFYFFWKRKNEQTTVGLETRLSRTCRNVARCQSMLGFPSLEEMDSLFSQLARPDRKSTIAKKGGFFYFSDDCIRRGVLFGNRRTPMGIRNDKRREVAKREGARDRIEEWKTVVLS